MTQFSGPADLGIQPTLWDRLVGLTAGRSETTMMRPMSVAATSDGRVIFVADPDALCVHRFDLSRGDYRCLDTDPAGQLLSPALHGRV